jgi:hypothetical protein
VQLTRCLAVTDGVLISALTTSFLNDVQNNPAVPKDLASPAQVELAGGVPLMFDKDLQATLDEANVPRRPPTPSSIVDENANARIDGLRASLSLLAVIGLTARFFSGRIRLSQPSVAAAREHPPESRASAHGRTCWSPATNSGLRLASGRRLPAARRLWPA